MLLECYVISSENCVYLSLFHLDQSKVVFVLMILLDQVSCPVLGLCTFRELILVLLYYLFMSVKNSKPVKWDFAKASLACFAAMESRCFLTEKLLFSFTVSTPYQQ